MCVCELLFLLLAGPSNKASKEPFSQSLYCQEHGASMALLMHWRWSLLFPYENLSFPSFIHFNGFFWAGAGANASGHFILGCTYGKWLTKVSHPVFHLKFNHLLTRRFALFNYESKFSTENQLSISFSCNETSILELFPMWNVKMKTFYVAITKKPYIRKVDLHLLSVSHACMNCNVLV